MTSPAASPQNFRDRLRAFNKCVCDGARLMVGQGDYGTYVSHIAKTHPDQTPMTEREFFRNRENARFGVGNSSGFRCC